eukprot:11786405-Heterocapsa_arctica.AAC.1
MRLYLGLVIASLACFAVALPVRNARWPSQTALYFGYFGIKFFPSLGFTVIYVYASEVERPVVALDLSH